LRRALNVTDYKEIRGLTRKVLKELLKRAKGSAVSFNHKRARSVLSVKAITPTTMNLMYHCLLREFRDAILDISIHNHRRKVLLHRKALEYLLNGKPIPEDVLREVRECRRETPLNKEVVRLAIKELEESGFEVNIPILIDKLREEGYDVSDFYQILGELVRDLKFTVLGSFLNSEKRVTQTAIDDFW